MSFSVSYPAAGAPAAKRAEVARSIRNGDHHKKGEHTQLDLSREYIAEQVEHTGTPDSRVAYSVSGHHSETGRSLSLSINVVQSETKSETDGPTSGGAEEFPAPSD